MRGKQRERLWMKRLRKLKALGMITESHGKYTPTSLKTQVDDIETTLDRRLEMNVNTVVNGGINRKPVDEVAARVAGMFQTKRELYEAMKTWIERDRP